MGNSCIPNNSPANESKGELSSLESIGNPNLFERGNVDSGQLFEIKEILYASEGLYEGEVDKNNKRQGYGVQKYQNGARYEGYWVNDRPMGNGNLVYANGDLYHGEVKDGKRHGYGTMTKPNGDQ